MLVCLGSALIMMINQFVYQIVDNGDPVRMGAQVVSGIGFLGAGTIMVTGRNQVKGITTAAGLWTSAALGLAIGIGFYEGAIIGGIAVFIVMAVMHTIDNFIQNRTKVIELYIEFNNHSPISSFLQYARQKGFDISNLQFSKENDENLICALLTAKSLTKRSQVDMLDVLAHGPGVGFIDKV